MEDRLEQIEQIDPARIFITSTMQGECLEIVEQVRRQVDAGMRAADACKAAAKASGFSKNELYRALLEE